MGIRLSMFGNESVPDQFTFKPRKKRKEET